MFFCVHNFTSSVSFNAKVPLHALTDLWLQHSPCTWSDDSGLGSDAEGMTNAKHH